MLNPNPFHNTRHLRIFKMMSRHFKIFEYIFWHDSVYFVEIFLNTPEALLRKRTNDPEKFPHWFWSSFFPYIFQRQKKRRTYYVTYTKHTTLLRTWKLQNDCSQQVFSRFRRCKRLEELTFIEKTSHLYKIVPINKVNKLVDFHSIWQGIRKSWIFALNIVFLYLY